MTAILLVDGVGNGVIVEREHDAVQIVVNDDTFVKTRYVVDGMDVYRLRCARPWPAIRHINKHLCPS